MNFIRCVLCLIIFACFSLQAEIKEIPLPTTCKVDFATQVEGANNHCLRLISSGNLQSKPDELIIYLHGDYGVGGASYMSHIAAPFAHPHRINIALIRPGYFDDKGHFSTGRSLGVTSTKIAGRLNNYTRENVDIIGQAILNLKNHYKPKRLLIIGHSGGAAIAALLLNYYPDLADGALLINCPCDLKLWRPDWEDSLSPIEHIKNIRPNTVVRILSGASDEVVLPELSKIYAEQLIKNGIDAKFYLGIGMEHNLYNKTEEIVSKGISAFLNEFSH